MSDISKISVKGTEYNIKDTTYSNFTGATSSKAGAPGLVPAPATTDRTKYLKGDGTWAEVGDEVKLYGSKGQNTDGAMTQKATTDELNAISGLIPSQATTSNQLADKAFVNSSIATSTATFRGTVNSVAELPKTGVDENDYAFVVTTDTAGNTVYNRYKYTNNAWAFEYALNNSSFTAAQWATINSGIDSSDLTQINTNKTNIANLQSGKQDKLTAGTNVSISGNKISATDTKYTAGTNVTIDAQNKISATDTKYTAGTNISISASNVISATGGQDYDYYHETVTGGLTTAKIEQTLASGAMARMAVIGDSDGYAQNEIWAVKDGYHSSMVMDHYSTSVSLLKETAQGAPLDLSTFTVHEGSVELNVQRNGNESSASFRDTDISLYSNNEIYLDGSEVLANGYPVAAYDDLTTTPEVEPFVNTAAIVDGAVTSAKIDDSVIAAIKLAMYPVGSIYMSATLSTASAVHNALGGTWTAWGKGKVPVGVNSSETEFNTVEKTGGEKTHTLTATEMPSHSHAASLAAPFPAGSSSYKDFKVNNDWNTIGNGGTLDHYGEGTLTTNTKGADGAHNNLQPYITCYMWKRTA